MNLVIPMAGTGKRFVDAGYDEPKPFVNIFGIPMIEWIFRNICGGLTNKFRLIIICQQQFLKRYEKFLRQILSRYFTDWNIVPIDKLTEGAACTVLEAQEYIDNEVPMILANCDQLVLDKNFMDESIDFYKSQDADGGILCFVANSPKWSYVEVKNDRVVRVVEKEPISNLATVGIYYFKQGRFFIQAAKKMIAKKLRVKNEFYIAPTYNEMIEHKQNVVVYMVNRMLGLGTPEDVSLIEERKDLEIHFSQGKSFWTKSIQGE